MWLHHTCASLAGACAAVTTAGAPVAAAAAAHQQEAACSQLTAAGAHQQEVVCNELPAAAEPEQPPCVAACLPALDAAAAAVHPQAAAVCVAAAGAEQPVKVQVLQLLRAGPRVAKGTCWRQTHHVWRGPAWPAVVLRAVRPWSQAQSPAWTPGQHSDSKSAAAVAVAAR